MQTTRSSVLSRRRMFGAVLLAIGLALASGIGVAAPACTLTKIEEWAVRSVHRYPVVDGTANGQPIGVMLDTGSTRSLILPSAARRLGLPRSQARGYRMFGVGGESPVEIARVDIFSIGRTVRKGWQLIVAGARELAPGVDVLLGEDFFQHTDVEFDLARGAVRLFEAKQCDGASLAYWTSAVTGEVAIEAVDEAKPQIVLPVKVNGRPMRALLDSGAPFSILTKRDAAAAGLTPGLPGVVIAGKGTGLGARSVDTWIGPIDTFTIGNESISGTAILFGDVFRDATYTETGSNVPRPVAGLQQMLLGVDFLRSHRVLVAHSQRKLYFSYVGGPVFQPRGALPPPAEPRPERDTAPPAGGG